MRRPSSPPRLLLVAALWLTACNRLLGIEEHAVFQGRDAGAGDADAGDASHADAVGDAGEADAGHADDGDATGDAPAPACPSIIVYPQAGDADWVPASTALYLTRATHVAEDLAQVWAPFHDYDLEYGIFESSTPHPPPYNLELSEGIAVAGFPTVSDGCIRLADVTSSPTTELVLSLALVTDDNRAPQNVSYELPDVIGPVIEEGLRVTATLSRDGQIINTRWDVEYPAASVLYGYAGCKHVMLNWDLMNLADPDEARPGAYTFTVSIHSEANAQSSTQLFPFTLLP